MIVRVLHDRQYSVPEEAVGRLEELDLALDEAMRGMDEAGFSAVLSELVRTVRETGKPLPADRLVPSDRTVPDPDSTIAELRTLLDDSVDPLAASATSAGPVLAGEPSATTE